MITFFVEKDLISFGNYMISKERKEDYAKQLEVDKISSYLSQVNAYDLQKWAQMEFAANTASEIDDSSKNEVTEENDSSDSK